MRAKVIAYFEFNTKGSRAAFLKYAAMKITIVYNISTVDC